MKAFFLASLANFAIQDVAVCRGELTPKTCAVAVNILVQGFGGAAGAENWQQQEHFPVVQIDALFQNNDNDYAQQYGRVPPAETSQVAASQDAATVIFFEQGEWFP